MDIIAAIAIGIVGGGVFIMLFGVYLFWMYVIKGIRKFMRWGG